MCLLCVLWFLPPANLLGLCMFICQNAAALPILPSRYIVLSYARGPEAPLLDDTLPQALLKTAERFPHHEALIVRQQDIRWTWRELAHQAATVAAGLLRVGLEPGDRVGIWASTCAEWVVVQHACAWAGLVLVNVNPAY